MDTPYLVFLEAMKNDPISTVKRISPRWQGPYNCIPIPFKTFELCLIAVEKDYTRLTKNGKNNFDMYINFIPPKLIKPIKLILLARLAFPLLQLGLSQNLMVMLCDELENQMFDENNIVNQSDPTVWYGETIITDPNTVIAGPNTISGTNSVFGTRIDAGNLQYVNIGIPYDSHSLTIDNGAASKISRYAMDCMVRIVKSL